jgi:TIR domain
MSAGDYHAWIFVSHASDDLPRVREVRNYLESKGASPLLFHLKALSRPEEFWPVIEREIAARNFFLYCQSTVADEREWVRRERAAVEAASRERPIRVDSVRVDGPELDLAKLDAFLAKTRVFPSYSHRDRETVRPFLVAMERAGFQVFSGTEIPAAAPWAEIIQRELSAAARDGWVVAFLSQFSMQRPNINHEIGAGIALGAKFIPVAIEKIIPPANLAHIQVFDATVDPATAPGRLVELMLRR